MRTSSRCALGAVGDHESRVGIYPTRFSHQRETTRHDYMNGVRGRSSRLAPWRRDGAI